ncbi:hypothetical protein [Streptomyces sp. G45]|uniref:DUF7848 domain-containing protein n=1 Tax=Streptomyces sp. G45 TaxID=3406627 RepID=UPI003C18055F
MTRFRAAYRTYTLAPNTDADAEPWTWWRECTRCGAASAPSGLGADGEEWTFAHLRANPAHLDYREHITRPYRAVPGAWQ